MHHYHYDGKSIGGSITTIVFAFIGSISIHDWAAIVAVATGLVTIGYTIFKWAKEAKK